jgi:hypothetical protein
MTPAMKPGPTMPNPTRAILVDLSEVQGVGP